jgi:O-antigen/teichoic acid export membrane protein
MTVMGNQLHSLSSQIPRLFSWIMYSKHASLAIVDQAVVSVSSIALTVVVARTAGIDLLGTVGFVLVLSVFGGIPVASLVSAPAMVLFGSMKEEAERYRGFLFLSAALIGLPLAVVLSAAYVLYRQRMGAPASQVEACIVAVLFAAIPVQDTLRRAAFARSRAWAGLRLSVIRNIPPPIVLLGVFWMGHPITLFDVVLVLVIANLMSIIADLLIDKPQLPDRGFSANMLHRHWSVSRWLLLSSFLNSSYEQIFTIASGIIFGDRAVAAIRISQQAFGVIVAGLQTFENTVPQQLALAAGEGRQPYRALVSLLAASVFLGVITGGVLLWWFGNDIIWFVLNVDYREYTNLLLFWSVATACSGARSIYAMAFRATEEAKPIFIADACSFFVGVIVAMPLLHLFGVIGSGIGMVITNLIGLLTLILAMRQNTRRSDEPV